jgi:hypothetical protein
MIQQTWRKGAIFDVINLGLGVFLFLSPWMFGFTNFGRHTSWMAGTAISIVALFAIVEFFESEEWINLIVGLWVATCPWTLEFFGFDAQMTMTEMQTHLLVGLVVALLASLELWLAHSTPPRVTG